jgi:hypothetical protein
VRCREAEAGVRFIGPRRRWGGGEVVDGGGVLLLNGFKGVKGGEEMGRRHLDGRNEEGGAPVWFGYSRVEESGRRRCTTRRRGRRCGGADGGRRGETTPWWAVPGRKAERSGLVSVGVKERRKWAEQ